MIIIWWICFSWRVVRDDNKNYKLEKSPCVNTTEGFYYKSNVRFFSSSRRKRTNNEKINDEISYMWITHNYCVGKILKKAREKFFLLTFSIKILYNMAYIKIINVC